MITVSDIRPFINELVEKKGTDFVYATIYVKEKMIPVFCDLSYLYYPKFFSLKEKLVFFSAD